MNERRQKSVKPETALNEALRFSLMLFKGFILLALLFYLGSGIFTVPEGNAGIVLVAGSLETDAGGRVTVYDPGLHFTMPPPVGKVILVPRQEVKHVITTSFLPGFGAEDRLAVYWRRSKEQSLDPADDGYVLCGDGAILHFKFGLSYKVADPVAYYLSFGMDAAREKQVVQLLLEEAVVRNALLLRPLESTDSRGGLTIYSGALKRQLNRVLLNYGLQLFKDGVSLLDAPNPRQVEAAFSRGQRARHTADDKKDAARKNAEVLLGAADKSDMPKVVSESREVIANAEIEAARIIEKAKRDRELVNRCAKVVEKDPQFMQRLFMETVKEVLPKVEIHPLMGEAGQREFRVRLQGGRSSKRKEQTENEPGQK